MSQSSSRVEQKRGEVGEYDITNITLGKGNFAKVYKGRVRATQEPVALKVIKVQQKMAYAEVKSLKRLRHPNIVQLLDSLHNEALLVMVVEYCEGGDFQKALQKQARGGLEESIARRICLGIAQGLSYLCDMNVMHRDLKPANVLLTSSDLTVAIPKIGDFGMAKEHENLAQSECGTKLYMAPERLDGKPYDFQSEVWSLGCIFYEALFGKSPFDHCRDLFELKRAASKPLVFPTDRVTSPEAKALITEMLQINPQKRMTIQQVVAHPWFSALLHPRVRSQSQPAEPAGAEGNCGREARESPARATHLDPSDVASLAEQDKDATGRRTPPSMAVQVDASTSPMQYRAPTEPFVFDPNLRREAGQVEEAHTTPRVEEPRSQSPSLEPPGRTVATATPTPNPSPPANTSFWPQDFPQSSFSFENRSFSKMSFASPQQMDPVTAARLVMTVAASHESSVSSAVLYLHAASIFRSLGDHDEAVAYTQQCAQLARSKLGPVALHSAQSKLFAAPQKLLLEYCVSLSRTGALEELLGNAFVGGESLAKIYRRARAVMEVLLRDKAILPEDRKKLVALSAGLDRRIAVAAATPAV